jgi:hypothetical protein
MPRNQRTGIPTDKTAGRCFVLLQTGGQGQSWSNEDHYKRSGRHQKRPKQQPPENKKGGSQATKSQAHPTNGQDTNDDAEARPLSGFPL